jgi:hypothetical protein
MNDNTSKEDAPDESLISSEDEGRLRKQVRHRLVAEYERAMKRLKLEDSSGQSTSTDRSNEYLSERLRVIREEEDAFYAERNLYRHKNHRGEYEWLSEEDRDQRQKNRHRQRSKKKPRESKSFIKFSMQRLDRVLGVVITTGLLIGITVVASLLVFGQSGKDTGYTISVHSEPPGAAIYVNGEPANKVTNSLIYVDDIGVYELSVAIPGYWAKPTTQKVFVTASDTPILATFTLYPGGGN